MPSFAKLVVAIPLLSLLPLIAGMNQIILTTPEWTRVESINTTSTPHSAYANWGAADGTSSFAFSFNPSEHYLEENFLVKLYEPKMDWVKETLNPPIPTSTLFCSIQATGKPGYNQVMQIKTTAPHLLPTFTPFGVVSAFGCVPTS